MHWTGGRARRWARSGSSRARGRSSTENHAWAGQDVRLAAADDLGGGSSCGPAAGFHDHARPRAVRRSRSAALRRRSRDFPSPVSPSHAPERRCDGCSERPRREFGCASPRASPVPPGCRGSHRRSAPTRGRRRSHLLGRLRGSWTSRVALTRAGTRLQADSPRFGLSAPTDALDDVALDARVAYRRLLLVGGECAVLFLVFAVVAASTLRSSALSATRRLRRFGARRWQADLLTAGEAIAIVVPATAVGWALGALVAAGLAEATDTPVSSLLGRTVLSPSGVGLAVLLAALGALILFATMRAQPCSSAAEVSRRRCGRRCRAAGRHRRARCRGDRRRDTRAGPRDGGRPATRSGAPDRHRWDPGRAPDGTGVPPRRASRTADPPFAQACAPSAARNPGTQLVTVGFLVVSVGLAVFAATYRSTLVEGQREKLLLPYRWTTWSERWARAGRAGDTPVGAAYASREAVPVIRRPARASSLNLSSTVDVLGVPSDAVGRGRWRSDFAGSGPEELGGAGSLQAERCTRSVSDFRATRKRSASQ